MSAAPHPPNRSRPPPTTTIDNQPFFIETMTERVVGYPGDARFHRKKQ
jgi:hypothetical protein